MTDANAAARAPELPPFDLLVLRAVGFAERPALEIALRVMPELKEARTVPQWLAGTEIWKALQRLVADGFLSERLTGSLFPHFKSARKSYRISLLGLDELEKAGDSAPVPPPGDTEPLPENTEDG